ncbi:MAG: transposase [Spirochaetota bacterium]|nr:transposase [Spirochaetota bacterium]
MSVPGISLIGAMEILLELQDFNRFNSAKELAAYVGLTPSQYSSSDKVRMGRITKVGKNLVRGGLVESSWILIRFDPAMQKKYNEIKLRSGAKRAIVAIARKLIIRIRRMILDNRKYVVGLVH